MIYLDAGTSNLPNVRTNNLSFKNGKALEKFGEYVFERKICNPKRVAKIINEQGCFEQLSFSKVIETLEARIHKLLGKNSKGTNKGLVALEIAPYNSKTLCAEAIYVSPKDVKNFEIGKFYRNGIDRLFITSKGASYPDIAKKQSYRGTVSTVDEFLNQISSKTYGIEAEDVFKINVKNPNRIYKIFREQGEREQGYTSQFKFNNEIEELEGRVRKLLDNVGRDKGSVEVEIAPHSRTAISLEARFVPPEGTKFNKTDKLLITSQGILNPNIAGKVSTRGTVSTVDEFIKQISEAIAIKAS